MHLELEKIKACEIWLCHFPEVIAYMGENKVQKIPFKKDDQEFRNLKVIEGKCAWFSRMV